MGPSDDESSPGKLKAAGFFACQKKEEKA